MPRLPSTPKPPAPAAVAKNKPLTYTKTDAAGRLGISRKTFYNWIAKGRVDITPDGRVTLAYLQKHGGFA